MTILLSKSDPFHAVAGIKPPDSRIARAAMELARDVSDPMLFHHVMRSYWFGELLGQALPDALDREIILLSAVLHDLGLTSHARGTRRFEVEGADAARQFVAQRGLAHDKAWMVHDTIMLHTMDHNLYRQPEARMVQGGILADVVGVGIGALDKRAVAEVVAAFPRLGFKREFARLLLREAEEKPHTHPFHPCTMMAHHCLGGVQVPDARPMIDGAPFDE